MKKTKKVLKIENNSLEKIAENVLFYGLLVFGLGGFGIVWAASTSTFSQSISAGTLSVDIVDSNGDAVGSPAVSFPAYSFSFDVGTSTATFGTASERMRISNPTLTDTWSLTLAPTGTQAIWFGSAGTYGYKSADHSTGTMMVDPDAGTVAGVDGCATTNVSKGSASYFSPGTQSVTLLTAASGAVTSCRWDFTGVGIDQEIPAAQAAGSYQIGMTLTVS